MPKKDLFMLPGLKLIMGKRGWINWHIKKYHNLKAIQTTRNLILVKRKDGSVPENINQEVRRMLDKRWLRRLPESEYEGYDE